MKTTKGISIDCIRPTVLVAVGSTFLAASALQAETQVRAWGAIAPVAPNLTNLLAISRLVALRTDHSVVDLVTGLPTGHTNVVAIASGEAHSLALKADGTVIAWGENRFGDTDVPIGLSNVVAIAASDVKSLALRADGTIVAWGYGEDGHTNVPACLSDVVALSAGLNFSVALSSDGRAMTFGGGQCGILNDVSNAVAIAHEDYHTIALKTDGTLIALGGYGPLDLASIVPTFEPATPPAGLKDVTAIATGVLHSLALKADGTVVAWGVSYSGQTNIPAGLTNVTAIAAADFASLALTGNSPTSANARIDESKIGSVRAFSCSIRTQSGKVYRLEYKNSLADTKWTALPLVAGNGGVLRLHDSTAKGDQRFYRARRW